MTAYLIELGSTVIRFVGRIRERARNRAKFQIASPAPRPPRRSAGAAAAEMGSPTHRRRRLAREASGYGKA